MENVKMEETVQEQNVAVSVASEAQLPEDKASYLNIDTSVLLERESVIKHAAIMDRYGIKIFDNETVHQINQYQWKEYQKTEFYRQRVFYSKVSAQDRELDTIRQQVFTVSYTMSREGESQLDQAISWQNILIIVMVLIIALIVGSSYAGVKRKERGRRLAHINNSYDE